MSDTGLPAEAVQAAERDLPPIDGEPLTHYFHCWRFTGHHRCAVALIERQGEENTSLIVKAAHGERLIRKAFHLRANGENAPGGTETWHQWERDAETWLRGQA